MASVYGRNMVGNGYLKKEQSYIKGKHFWSPRHVQKCTILCEPKIRKKIKKQIPTKEESIVVPT